MAPFHLVLIGYRGSGKTTVGSLLARRLGRELVDVDLLVELEAGCSIAEIFRSRGEAAFRALEAGVVRREARPPGADGILPGVAAKVIATGGGVVLDWGNVEALRAGGRLVYLEADPGELASRITLDPATARRRPPLMVGGGAAADEVVQVLAARRALYQRAAHYTVKTGGRTPAEVADLVLQCFQSG